MPRPSAAPPAALLDRLHDELTRCPATRRRRLAGTVRCQRPLGHAWLSPHPTGRRHAGVDRRGRRVCWAEPEATP